MFGDYWHNKQTNIWILNDIGRNSLLGKRKKIAKFLMRTLTYRSTFLYDANHCDVLPLDSSSFFSSPSHDFHLFLSFTLHLLLFLLSVFSLSPFLLSKFCISSLVSFSLLVLFFSCVSSSLSAYIFLFISSALYSSSLPFSSSHSFSCFIFSFFLLLLVLFLFSFFSLSSTYENEFGSYLPFLSYADNTAMVAMGLPW